MDFVRYSEGQEINNTTMTQELRLHEVVWGTHKISMYALFWECMKRVKSGPREYFRPSCTVNHQ